MLFYPFYKRGADAQKDGSARQCQGWDLKLGLPWWEPPNSVSALRPRQWVQGLGPIAENTTLNVSLLPCFSLSHPSVAAGTRRQHVREAMLRGATALTVIVCGSFVPLPLSIRFPPFSFIVLHNGSH